MHECEECGQTCDCDGDDLWRDTEPADHVCANADCGIDEDDMGPQPLTDLLGED